MLIFNIQGQMWIWYPMLYINTMKLTHTLGNGSQLFKGKFKQINEPVTERKKWNQNMIAGCNILAQIHWEHN